MKPLKDLLKTAITNDEPITESDIAIAIRSMIAAEFDAIKLYTEFMNAIDNEKVKQVLASVIEEERVHVGEFQSLLFMIDPMEKELYDKGAAEVQGESDVTV